LFESRVLRKVVENTGEWRRHDFYFSSNKIRVMKSICVGLVRYVTRKGGRELNSGFWWYGLKIETS
jgi:hypothetical protein